MGLNSMVASALNNLGRVLTYGGQLDEARAVEADAIALFQQIGDARLLGGSQLYLAEILLLAGEPEAALREGARR